MTITRSRSAACLALTMMAVGTLIGAAACNQTFAQDGEPSPLLELKLNLDRTTCLLGDEVTLTASLTGLEPLGSQGRQIKTLAFDYQSLSFELHYSNASQTATRFHYLRYHPSVYPQERQPLEVVHFSPGETKTLPTTMLAVKTGKLSIRAIYNGLQRDRDAPAIYSPPVTLEVTPREGKSDLCVRMETTLGTVVGRLWPADALGTVINFATLVRQKRYDGLTFHRVIGPSKVPPAGFMIQGGCPKGDGTAGPGWTIPEEFNNRAHKPGVFSMARSRDPNSAGSQFFICLNDLKQLDGKYTTFGNTLEGIDVVRAIGAVETDGSDRPTTPVRIVKARLDYR